MNISQIILAFFAGAGSMLIATAPFLPRRGRSNLAESAGRHGVDELAIAVANEALKPIRELHKPFWDNCINACCSGEQCKHRSRCCGGGCDEGWPCDTARLVYTSEELGDA